MSLRERLRRMGIVDSATKPSAEPEPAPQRAAIPGAHSMATAAGEAWCIEQTFPLTEQRGSVAVAAALDVAEHGWQRLLHRHALRSVSATTIAFLDTETTGLERGTGTYAFLVGIGRITDDSFRVRQFFMRDYDEEPAQLEAIVAELDGVETLVSFNGRTFDWPLLQTRAILNRIRLPELQHLDLLHPARRFWGQVTVNCRLVQLEEEILGVTREGDVPGHLIPYLFFDFLQTGDAKPLMPVFQHNRLDILSTAAFAGYLGHAVANPLHAKPTGELLPGSDLYAVGRLLVDQGKQEEGIRCLEAALARNMPGHVRTACSELLGTLYKRTKQYDCAVDLWHDMVREGRSEVFAHIELAKYYEHQAKDLEAARRFTLQAIETVQRRRTLRGLKATDRSHADTELAPLLHRLRRLENRLARRKERRPDHPA